MRPTLLLDRVGRVALVSMDFWMQAEDDGAAVTPLMRCPEFEQRLLRPELGDGERCDHARDEVLYVLAGAGSVTLGDERHDLSRGAAMFVARGTAWSVDATD